MPISDFSLPALTLAAVYALPGVLRGIAWVIHALRCNDGDRAAVARALGSTSRTLSLGRQADTRGNDTVAPG